MEGIKFLFVALFLLSAIQFADAGNKQLTYYENNCNRAQKVVLDLSLADVGYIGPAPGSGHQICLIDETRLLLCTKLDDTITLVVGDSCTNQDALICPSVKSVPFGLGCVEGVEQTFTNVFEGKGLCIADGTGNRDPVACKTVRTPWVGSFFTKGVLRGAENMLTEEKGEEEKVEEENEAREMDVKGERETEDNAAEVSEEVKSTEFLPKYPPLAEGESWYICWFNSGELIKCKVTSITEPWVPLPYPGFSGYYIASGDSNKTIGYVTGNITIEGLQSAFSNALQFFANAIFH